MAHTCNLSYPGGWGRRITWTWEMEVTVSRDWTTTLQPGQQSKTQVSKKKERNNRIISPKDTKWRSIKYTQCKKNRENNKNNLHVGLGTVAHPVILALWEAKGGGGSPEVRSSRPAWPTWQNPISTKNTKISQTSWNPPAIPVTWEAEAGELLEPGNQRLQWAEIATMHSSPGDRVRVRLKKKRERDVEVKPLESFVRLKVPYINHDA